MPSSISDQQLVVGTFAELDVLNLPADDAITAVAPFTVSDVDDAGTDVTVVSGDASSGTSDGNLNTFTVQATGTGVGEVTYSTTVTTASGASLPFSDTATVNGGSASSIAASYGTPQAIPAQ
jgi:hypothetical protein